MTHHKVMHHKLLKQRRGPLPLRVLGSRPWLFTRRQPTRTKNIQHRKDRVLGSQSLAVYRCEVLGSSSLAVHLMNRGRGGGTRGPASGRGARPGCRNRAIKSTKEKGACRGRFDNSWERDRAKHKALRTNQMLHISPCKALRGCVGHIKLPFGCKVTADAGHLL